MMSSQILCCLAVSCMLFRGATQPSQSEFIVEPQSVVTTENKSNFVQFNCTSPVNTFQEWRINGTPLFQFRKELPDINITSTQQVGERVPSILYVPTNETSNNTNVTCFAIFDVENDKLSISSTATLLIQGLLAAVRDLTIVILEFGIYLNEKAMIISWTSPFSLQLTDSDVYMTFSIDIYNVTDGSRILFKNRLTETYYTFRINTSTLNVACEELNITVTAVNGAGNGTRKIYFEVLDNEDIEYVGVLFDNCGPGKNEVFKIEMTTDFPVCNCLIELENGNIFNESNGLTCDHSLRLTTTDLLLFNIYQNVSITLINSAESRTVSNKTMSTHITRNITVSVHQAPNTVNISLTRANTSCIESSVLILIVYYNDSDNQINSKSSFFTSVSAVDSNNTIIIQNVSRGRKEIIVFDLINDRRPPRTVLTPAAIAQVEVEGDVLKGDEIPDIFVHIQQKVDVLFFSCNYSRGCTFFVQLIDTHQFSNITVVMTMNDNSETTLKPDNEGSYSIKAYQNNGDGFSQYGIVYNEEFNFRLGNNFKLSAHLMVILIVVGSIILVVAVIVVTVVIVSVVIYVKNKKTQ